jgi:hypothetical protein
MLGRRTRWLLLAGLGGCFPSFDHLSGSARSLGDEEAGAIVEDSATSDAAGEVSVDLDAASEIEASDATSEPSDMPFPLPPDAPTNGLYFYWPFESGSTKVADDVSGNHRNGTLSNVSTSTLEAPTARPGNVRSVKFEMPQSSISYLADAPADAYTIAMWVKPAARSKVLVISREDPTTRVLLMQLRVTGTGVFEHYVNDGSSGAGCQQTEPGSCISGTTVVQSDTWYHVAVSAMSGGEMHLYVNGFEEGAPRTIMPFQLAGERYDFGYEVGRSTGGFQGVVDEIVAYDWVLPSLAINKLAAPM